MRLQNIVYGIILVFTIHIRAVAERLMLGIGKVEHIIGIVRRNKQAVGYERLASHQFGIIAVLGLDKRRTVCNILPERTLHATRLLCVYCEVHVGNRNKRQLAIGGFAFLDHIIIHELVPILRLHNVVVVGRILEGVGERYAPRVGRVAASGYFAVAASVEPATGGHDVYVEEVADVNGAERVASGVE